MTRRVFYVLAPEEYHSRMELRGKIKTFIDEHNVRYVKFSSGQDFYPGSASLAPIPGIRIAWKRNKKEVLEQMELLIILKFGVNHEVHFS